MVEPIANPSSTKIIILLEILGISLPSKESVEPLPSG